MHEYEKILLEKAKQAEISLTQPQAATFIAYMELLLAWNSHTNLTAIDSPTEVLEKHFIDSLLLSKALVLPAGARVMDVGSGAGFPGMPLKILRPDIHLTALDSANKRLAFLRALGEELNIAVELVHARAEELGKQPAYRGQYDLVTARAVAAMPVLVEYCVPFVKVGGTFAAMKGPMAEQEALEAANAARLLGCEPAKLYTAALPGGDKRGIILLRKKAQTPPAYPRHGGTIQKKPL